MGPAAQRPNRVYYIEIAPGRWRGTFAFRATSWRDLRRARIGIAHRTLATVLAVIGRLFGPSRVVARIRAEPSHPPAGVSRSEIRIRKLGLTLYRIREEYRLQEDGERIVVVARERTGPFPFARWREKRYTACVGAGGMESTYELTLLGATWTAHYVVAPDRDHVEARLQCPWAEAVQRMRRVT